MASDTSTWTNYWDSNDYSTWKDASDKAWGGTTTATYNAEDDKEKYSWDASSKAGGQAAGALLSGAGVGAGIGLAFGGIGALLGGIVGGVISLFDSLFGSGKSKRDAEQREYNSYLQQITYQKENLTTQYNRSIEDLQTQREQLLQELNTQNERYQQATDRTVTARDNQLTTTAQSITAQSIENANTLKEMQRELIKTTSTQTAELASSGFRQSGTATSQIKQTQAEGEEEIRNTSYQMNSSLYTSNSQMAENYTSSTYTAYGYQNNISDATVKYQNWLKLLETELARLKENYENSMSQYDQALQDLRDSKDYNSLADALSGLSSGLTSFASSAADLVKSGKNLFGTSNVSVSTVTF